MYIPEGGPSMNGKRFDENGINEDQASSGIKTIVEQRPQDNNVYRNKLNYQKERNIFQSEIITTDYNINSNNNYGQSIPQQNFSKSNVMQEVRNENPGRIYYYNQNNNINPMNQPYNQNYKNQSYFPGHQNNLNNPINYYNFPNCGINPQISYNNGIMKNPLISNRFYPNNKYLNMQFQPINKPGNNNI